MYIYEVVWITTHQNQIIKISSNKLGRNIKMLCRLGSISKMSTREGFTLPYSSLSPKCRFEAHNTESCKR